MAETIDKLQVEIEATAKGTSQVFSSLLTQLSSLKSALNGLSATQITKIQKQLSSLSSTVSKTSSVSVNTSGMSKSEKDISNSVNKIKQSLAGLESYKNAALSGDSSSLTSFNRRVISIQSSVDVLSEKLRELGDTRVQSTEFVNLENQINTTKSKLEDLESQMQSLPSTSGTSSDAYTQLQSEIQTTSNELDGLIDKQNQMLSDGTAYTDPFEGYRNSLTNVQDELSATKSEVSSAVGQMNSQELSINAGDVISTLKSVASNALSAASSLLKMSSSAIKSGFNSIKSKLSSIKSTLSNIGSTSSGAVSTGFTKILKYAFGIRSMYVLFRRLRTAIKDAFTELQESGANVEETTANVNALKTALYTLKYQFGAAFEPIFNTVAPALETMINYLVAAMNTISAFIAKITGASTYSKAVVTMNSVSDSASSAASSTEDLNKQLQGFDELNNLSGDDDSGSGGSGSSSSDDYDVTYVEESVDSVLTSFWDSLYDAISSGDWWKVGSLISEELTSALNSINWDSIFQTASDFGTNLASFLNGLISDDLFSALGTTIANSIKTALFAALSFSEKFSWTGLGNAIASGINSFMDENPLSLAVDTANSWINGILDSLIAAVSGISWSTLSNHIADAIGSIDTSGFGERLGTLANNIANALYTLVSNKDTWSNLGTKIGEGISSFFKSMNTVNGSTGKTGWQALGSTISSTISGIGTAITDALNTVNWEEVGQGIADFISSINWDDIKFTFKNLITALKNAIVGILKGLNLSAEDVAGISVGIGAIALTLLTISGLSLAASITKKVITDMIANAIMAKLGTSAGAAVSIGSIGSTIAQVGLVIAFTVASWKIGTMAYENATGKAAPSFGEMVSTLASDGAFGDLVNGIKLDLEGDVSITWDLSSTLASLTGNNATMVASQYLSEYGADIVQEVQQGAQNEINNNSGSIWTGIWNQFKALVGAGIMGVFGIHSPATAMEPYGENILLGILEGFKNKMSDFSSVISTLKDNIVSWLQQKFSNFSLSNYISGWGDVTATVSAKLGTPINTLKSWGTSFVNNITNKWTDVTSTVKAVLGGDLEQNGINTFTTWSSFIETLKSHWTGKSATFKSSVGGQISQITDLTTWQTTFSNLKSAWTDKAASFKASVGGQISKYTDLDSWKTKISNLTGAWFGKSATFAASLGSGTTTQKIDDWKSKISGLTGAWVGKSATFAASLANGTTTEKIGGYTTAISNLSSAWKSPSRAYFQADFDESLSTLQSFAEAIKTIYDNWKGRNAEFTMSAEITTSNLSEVADSLVTAINNKLKYTSKRIYIEAEGGVLTNGGWKSIPQYASGSLNTGSLFFAGEKSGNPELVGHVNGRTEVLNKSQIASTMYAAMTNAMRNFGSPTAPPTIKANGSVGTYNPNNTSGSNSDALLMEQNRLIAEQNMLLERIAEKDTTISVNDIFSAMRVESNNYYNRTGNSAFVGF